MLITNTTTQDYWFGPLHLLAGVGQTLTVDDTTATSLYLTNDEVADQINTLADPSIAKITVSGAAAPFPRATGEPLVLHGDGSPEGLVYAPQGSVFLSRSAATIYQKTTGVHSNTGWQVVGANGLVAPSGSMQMFGGPSAPAGWLLCDGSAISRATYSVLFAVTGVTYGSGDGSTTFNVPDLRGRAPIGYAASGGHTDVSALGNNDGVAEVNRRPKHRHTVTDPGHNHSPNARTSGSGTNGSASVQYDGTTSTSVALPGGTATTGITVGASTDSLDAPAYLVVNYIIKT
jgi:microcystin-dependent protein